MIHYLVHPRHAYTMGVYLEHWSGSAADRFRVIHYRANDDWGELPSGVYIFSDLERLDSTLQLPAIRLRRQLASRPDTATLNDPEHSLCRYDLLKSLFDKGRNVFRARRWSESRIGMHFPVFLRRESDHAGSISSLLSNDAELLAATGGLQTQGSGIKDLLVIEFVDTADAAGIYRKYSYFRVGDRLVPRNLAFSRKWMIKFPDLLDEEKLREEREFLEGNPHEQVIRQVFDLARVDYGRIDYAMLDGKVQVWEINTNPMVLLRPTTYDRRHMQHQDWFADRIRSVFVELDEELHKGPYTPWAGIH